MPTYHQLIEAIRILLLAHVIGEPDTLARAIEHARELLKKAQNCGRGTLQSSVIGGPGGWRT
jgi:hypothetical protein